MNNGKLDHVNAWGRRRDVLAGWAAPQAGATGQTTATLWLHRWIRDDFDIPPLESGRFSVLWGCLCNRSPKALPEPFYILGGVMIPMEARSAVRAGMPANG
jgi:hypothetical protein